MRWLSVTQNEAVFKGRSNYVNPSCNCTIDAVSKNFAGLGINFTPTWFQVFPGVDLSAPVAWSQGIDGNAAVLLGGYRGAGNYSIGVGRRHLPEVQGIAAVHRLLRKLRDRIRFGAVTVVNGTTAALSDRGWLSLTLKATF